MRIVFINYNDYSNLTFGWSQSLKSVGLDSDCFTLTRHDFDYHNQAEYVSQDRMKREISAADIVVIGHSKAFLLEMVKPFNKRVYVAHTGTEYRQSPNEMNAIFNTFVSGTITDSPEFMTLGARNIVYVAAAIDTDTIVPRETNNNQLLFAHYPSKAINKGSDFIRKTMSDLLNEVGGFAFDYSESNLPHEANLERISKCDIYIEMFMPEQTGKPYGSFGVTAFEAAAMNKIVITNCAHLKVYKQAYSCIPKMIIANTETEFIDWIKIFIRDGISDIGSRNWIVEKHGLQATGKYLKQILGL